MAESERGGITPPPTRRQEAGKQQDAPIPRLTPVEQNFWQNIITRSGDPGPVEDPLFYPVQTLARAENFILNGTRGPDGRLRHEEERAQITPFLESIRRIKTAYQILAHPYLDYLHRGLTEEYTARDRSWHERDRVTLSDKEAMILTAITETVGIPSDPARRTYLHADVAYSPEEGPLKK